MWVCVKLSRCYHQDRRQSRSMTPDQEAKQWMVVYSCRPSMPKKIFCFQALTQCTFPMRLHSTHARWPPRTNILAITFTTIRVEAIIDTDSYFSQSFQNSLARYSITARQNHGFPGSSNQCRYTISQCQLASCTYGISSLRSAAPSSQPTWYCES